MTARRAVRAVSIASAALLLLALAVFGASELRFERIYATPTRALSVAVVHDAETLARGRHLGVAIAQCSFCHGDDLGGRSLADDPWVGRLWAPNLTSGRGGLPPDYRDEDLARAIRHGVDRDGRALALMPSDQLRALSDEDLAAIVAWLRGVPPVDGPSRERVVGPLTRAVLASGLAPDLLAAERIDHTTPPPPGPEPAANAAYGEYLVAVGICRVCHRPDLEGGLHPLSLPGEPPPPDLTASGPLGGWSEADFVRSLRTGIAPDGRVVDPEFMPWPRYGQMSDLELRALFAYLRTLP